MNIFRTVAGFSFGRADIVRRAMSKKKASALAAERDNFVNGAEERGIDRAVAEQLFADAVGAFQAGSHIKGIAAFGKNAVFKEGYDFFHNKLIHIPFAFVKVNDVVDILEHFQIHRSGAPFGTGVDG